MDLPQYYFPVRICPHLGENGNQKMAFADYGSCSNVNENENVCGGPAKCIPQKAHGHLSGLDNVLPMLPLAEHLNMKGGGIGSQDIILGFDNFANLFKSLDGLLVWLNMAKLKISVNAAGSHEKFKHCKAIIKKLHNKYKHLYESKGHLPYDAHSLRNALESLEQKMPKWMVIMLKNYSRLQMAHNDYCFRGFNRDFYKGLLCCLEGEDSSPPVLFHGGGAEFKEIHMTKVSRDRDSSLYSIEKTCQLTLDEPVYQISSSRKGLTCIRQKNRCSVLIHDISEHSLHFGNSMSVETDHLSDVNPSPFLAHEILLSEKSGVVTLWNINTNNCQRLTKKQKFECTDAWTSSYFAGHPRQIVIADSTSVELFDHRDSFRKGSDLFTLSPMLVKDELVMSVIPFDFPYHIIGTDSTIFMMDQRFPCSPVLQWHLDRMSSPQMLHVKKISETGAVFFVATQQPAEVICVPVNFETRSPPMCKLLPWQVGKPRDIFYEESQSMGVEWSELGKRFLMSMAGMTVVDDSTLDQAFSIFQMDSCGDLFYQQFAFEDRIDHAHLEQYKLKEPSFEAREEGCQRVHKCLSSLDFDDCQPESNIQPQELDAKSSYHLKFTDLAGLFEGLTEDESESAGSEPHESPPDLPDWDKVIAPWHSLPNHGVNTLLHIALREGGDFKDLLVERENDHEEKKLAMREQALKSKSSKKSSLRKRKIE